MCPRTHRWPRSVTAPISSSRAPPAGWPTSSSRATATSATALQESPCAPRCRLGRGAGGDGPSPADHRVGDRVGVVTTLAGGGGRSLGPAPGIRESRPRGATRALTHSLHWPRIYSASRDALARDRRAAAAPALSQAGCCRCFGGCTPRTLTAVTVAPFPMAWNCVPCDDQRPSPRRRWVAGLALSGVCPRFQDRGRTADTRRAASRGRRVVVSPEPAPGLFTAQRREEPPRGWRRPARRAR